MPSDPEPLSLIRKRFEHFYARYPRKVSRQDAWRAFLKLRPDGPAFRVIMDGLERCKSSHEWTNREAKYIPYPATWLRAAGWLDEFEDPAPVTSLYDAQQSYDKRPGIF